MKRGFDLAVLACFCLSGLGQGAAAQKDNVTVRVEMVSLMGDKKVPTGSNADNSNVVAWLTPASGIAAKVSQSAAHPQLAQKNKMFEPHVLAIQAGTVVIFPNKDHFLHNVFSLYDGKRFDLGFYEAGSSKAVRFDRVGVSFLFCNIHPEMSAVVVAVDTPYFGVSDQRGDVSIAHVPDGDYVLHVWSEKSLPMQLKLLDRAVKITMLSRDIGPIQIAQNPTFSLAHKNKYGENYAPPTGTGYDQP